MTIQFNAYLKDEDWMPAMKGWRCDALLIPGTKFEALYHDGTKLINKLEVSSVNPPRIHTSAKAMSMSEDQCIDSLAKRL